MLNYYGHINVTGKLADLERFLTEACHGTVLEDNRGINIKQYTFVEGTDCGVIFAETTIFFNYPKDYKNPNDIQFADFPYCQPIDISAEEFKKLSKNYNLDFTITATGLDEATEVGFRTVSVINGKIMKNQYKNYIESVTPDKLIQNTEARSVKTDTPVNHLLPWQTAILKYVADEQKERYIEKCPKCGHDNMYTDDAHTFNLSSRQANIYICRECFEAEEECCDYGDEECSDYSDEECLEEDFPLSYWAVFDPDNHTAFFLKGRKPE